MAQRPTRNAPEKPSSKGREDRLKQALKANMARRKAQAKARSAGEDGAQTTQAGKSAPEQ